MEYTQWVEKKQVIEQLVKCLNPCCNGIYSMRSLDKPVRGYVSVLILVVMEYTQWVFFLVVQWLTYFSLNPCCNGIYSMS